MRKLLALAVVSFASGVQAQTQNSTTSCNVIGGFLNCNTTTTTQPPPSTIDWNAYNQRQQQINQQNQQNMNQVFQNLGAAIAADRERRRQQKEAERQQSQADAQQSQQDAMLHAMQTALARDNAPLPPAPDETPVLLSCVIGPYSTSLALYEKAGRVDVTEVGVTKARAATFTPQAVTWTGSVWRTAISRLDLSLISTGILPEMAGAQVTGTCSLAERKF